MSTDFLTVEEKQLIADDFTDMADDEQMGVEITYRKFISKGALDPITRTIAETYTDVTINALRFPLLESEMLKSGGRYQEGDVQYLIKATDVPTPTKDDRIVDGTATRYVFQSDVDILSTFVSIIARKISG